MTVMIFFSFFRKINKLFCKIKKKKNVVGLEASKIAIYYFFFFNIIHIYLS